MELTTQDKEELFGEFLLKMAELDHADKTQAAAQNNHCLAGVSRYFHENYDYTNPKAKYRSEVQHYFYIYNCYKKLRAAIPAIVMAKKYSNPVDHPNLHLIRKTKGQGSSNPVLMEEDIEEANKVGKILLDAMWQYLTDEAE